MPYDEYQHLRESADADIVKAHDGLTGRTGLPCSYCDAEDHTFVACEQAAAFSRGEASFWMQDRYAAIYAAEADPKEGPLP